ncbi:MAG: hypothetical protein IKI02_03950 [Oscillospiraceae bacterium]|nr:hypothetical protein [Oscillospiraceae bacterium]
MFCEKCGTRVDDGLAFCPNCGNRLSVPAAPEAAPKKEAPVEAAPPEKPAQPAPAPAAAASAGAAAAKAASAPKKPIKLPSLGGLTDKFNKQKGNAQIFYGSICLLLIVCCILSVLKVYTHSSTAFSLGFGPTWLFFVNTVLFTLCITFFLLDALGKFTFRGLWLFIAIASALILILYVLVWISGVKLMGFVVSVRLTVGGWFFLILQLALVAVCILYMLERKKNQKK